MYLVDTNLVAEVLLRQAKAEEVKRFLESTTRGSVPHRVFVLFSGHHSSSAQDV
jgi:hypothetical protein